MGPTSKGGKENGRGEKRRGGEGRGKEWDKGRVLLLPQTHTDVVAHVIRSPKGTSLRDFACFEPMCIKICTHGSLL